MTTQTLMHVPVRPRWHCAACAQPWPCPEAKRELSEEFGDQDGTALIVYLGMQMWTAIEDATQYPKLGPQPATLRQRFIAWAEEEPSDAA